MKHNEKHIVWKGNDDLIVEAQSSIEIKQTTKGVNFTVKVYDIDPFNALKVAADIFDKCEQMYCRNRDDIY